MDKFIVSARKYRPQNFSTVIGQSHITTTLKNAINHNQLAHAFLFCGPRGVGKTTCARILAKTINCEHRTKEGEACNQCTSCVSFDKGTSFNIHEMDAASNNSVDDMKEVVDSVRFAPQHGNYKVYIIDEVHQLSSSAFNAFLKTLEEPPPYAIFILATTEKQKILPTILSRCQIFDFKRINTQDTAEHLKEITSKEGVSAEPSSLHVIAQKSEGCLRDALSILDKIVSFTSGHLTYANTLEHLNILDEDYYFKIIEQLVQQQLPDSLLLFDQINRKGFEGDTFLEGFTEFIRNLLVCKDEKAMVLLDVADDFKPRYAQFAQSTSIGWLIGALNITNDAIIQYKQARNKKLQVELTLIKLSYLNKAIELSQTEGGLNKKKIVDTTKPVSFRNIPLMIPAPTNSIHPLPLNEKPSTATLLVDVAEKREVKKNIPGTSTPPPAKIEKSVTTAPAPPPATEKVPAKLGSLSKLREQAAQELNKQTASLPLTEISLQDAWNAYIQKLLDANNHSAANNFKICRLEIVDENNIQIITDNNLQNKFIDAETSALISHFQHFFNNKQFKYQLILEEKINNEHAGNKPLSTKEHYLLIATQYPLVKKLKDDLKLELEF